MSETKRLAIPSSSLRPTTIYTTSNPLARDQPISSRPSSTYSTISTASSPASSRQYSSSTQDGSKYSSQSRPSTIYISSNVSQSFKVVRRQRQRRPSRRGTHNVLNQTLDNFYNTLRRTKTYQTVNSANNWVNEYETYRKSVILEEKEYENYRLSMIISPNENENDENNNNYNDFEPTPKVNVRHRRHDENSSSTASSVSSKSTKMTTKQQSRLSKTAALGEKENQMIARYQNSLNNREDYKITEPLYSNYI